MSSLPFRPTLSLLWLVLLMVAAAWSRPLWHQLDEYTFERFVTDFDRAYERNSSEWHLRKKTFAQHLASIRAHNADPTSLYKRGVNQFTDWTDDEWSSYNRATIPTAPLTDGNLRAKQMAASGYPLPQSVDYRTHVPAIITGIKNQGHCGACWAHTAAECVESYLALRTGQLHVLSQGQINACVDSMMGCGGGQYISGWQYVYEHGLYEVWAYPFEDFWAKNMTKEGTSKCRSMADAFLPGFRWPPRANVTGITQLTTNSANATMEALAYFGPVAAVVAADDWASYETGIFHIPAVGAKWTINHAIQIVGYGYDSGLRENYWTVRNSWGSAWGEAGYIRLARPAVEPCGYVNGYTICGTSAVLYYNAFPTVEPFQGRV